jgi:Fic family protein
VAYEQVPWESRYEIGEASRTQLLRHRGPYRAAIPSLIAQLPVSLPPGVVALSSEAASEVARFDAEIGGEIAPFAAVLLRSESAASSQIENLTASARAIAEAELGQRPGANASMVVGNVAAMTAASALSDDVSAQAIRDMHAALMASADPEAAGRWRDQQVWIGGSRLGPHTAAFVPPIHQRVPGLIDDLVAFMARDDVPVLAHAALAHAQFEAIHPFEDGNGRTGRALVHAMLRSKGLTRTVTVPISAGLLVEPDAYFAALTAYRSGDLEPIVERFADAAFAAVANGRVLVGDLRVLRSEWESRVVARRGAAAWRVADLLLRQPVVNASAVAEELHVASQNVYRALDPLLEAGVLVTSGSRRDRIWWSPEVLAAVDAFAERAGRRARPGR